MKHLFSSIHFRLLLVVLLAVVPSFGLILYTNYELRKQAISDIEKDVSQLANIISLEEAQLILATRQLLISVAEIPRITQFDTNYSDKFFKELISHFQRYANFGVINPIGDLVSSAVSSPGLVNLSDRSYFRRALETREFSIGDFQIGRITGKPSINFAYPVLDQKGQVKAVVFAAVDLEWLSEHEHAAVSRLQAGSIFAKIDTNGIIVAYQPDLQHMLGRPAPWSFLEPLKGKAGRLAESDSPDGTCRVYAIETVSASRLYAGNLTVVLGVPKDSLLAASTRHLIQNAAVLGALAILAVVFAEISSAFLILRPARLILRTTQDLRSGNMGVRTGLDHRQGEIGLLGQSFDRMAETLENQERENIRMIGVLRESEERYRTLVETSPDAIVMLDEKFKIMMVNQADLALSGYDDPNQLVGKSIEEFLVSEDRSRIADDIARFLQTGTVRDVEYTLVRKDGKLVPVEARAAALKRDNRLIGIIAVIRDISGRRLAEEERKRMQAQLLQAQKMDSIGTLAGGVAHDFNNVLTVIVGHSDFAMAVLEKDHRIFPGLREIHRAAMRAADLTHQLLLFSRRQPMELIPLDLNKTIESLLKMLRRLIGEDIQINAHLAPDLWTVRADAGNMEQIIMNIAVNARDAIQAGGTLSVRTTNETIDEGYCALYSFARPGKFICLSIADTGAGMTAEVLAQIFEPFFTTKGTGKGTGLGLSVVYGIVKQHEGWITVKSEPGKGTTFFIYLPAVSGRPAESEEDEISLVSLRGKGQRVLVVEDEDSIRHFVESALRENGYLVTGAVDGRSAMEVFEKEAGAFDLVLSDVVLPDRSGIDVVQAMLSQNVRLKVLLSSGYTDDKSQWEVIRRRGFRFMQKPFTLIGLLSAVRASIEENLSDS